MIELDSNKKIKSVLFWLIILSSIFSITILTIKYSFNKNYTSVDKIPCAFDSLNCFTPDSEGENAYKLLIITKSVIPNCIEKNELCEINKICEGYNANECKVIGCKDEFNIIPQGYEFSKMCFESQ